MALISEKRLSSMRKISILDYDVIIMCPSDLIGWDDRGKKGVGLGQKILGEPVSD